MVAKPPASNNLVPHHYQSICHKHTQVTDALTLEVVKHAAGLLQRNIAVHSYQSASIK
jgi:acetylglutamate kinase